MVFLIVSCMLVAFAFHAPLVPILITGTLAQLNTVSMVTRNHASRLVPVSAVVGSWPSTRLW